MRLINKIKIKLAIKQNTNAKEIFPNNPTSGRNIKANKIPIFAASKVPAVVGDTNLFCAICCIIKPATDIPAPVISKDKVRGILLAVKTRNCSSSIENSSLIAIDLLPTIKEMKLKAINKLKSKNLFTVYIFTRKLQAKPILRIKL